MLAYVRPRPVLGLFALLAFPWVLLGAMLPLAPMAAADDVADRKAVAQWADKLADKRIARDPFEQRQRERALRELGKIATKEAAIAVLPIFADPFVHLHDRAVSAWISMLKGQHAGDVQTWMTSRALSHRQPSVRRAAAVALGLTSGPEIAEPLRLALRKEKNGRVLEALAHAVLQMRVKPDLGGALLGCFRNRDGEALFAVAQAAAAFDGQAAVKPLLKLLRHRSPIARAGAVLALQRLDALPAKQLEVILVDTAPAPAMALAESLEFETNLLPWPEKGVPLLERLLAAPSWRVRAAAIQSALRVWRKEIMDLLMARLGKEPGRLADDVRRALETYTGKTIGEDPDLWRAWWIQNHADFDAGPRPEKDRSGNIRFRDAGSAGAEGLSGTVAFFNLPLRSKRLAFVFDLSGSMRNAATKGADSERTKIELLQEEFQKTLAALPQDTVFDLYVYRYWSEFPPLTKLTRALGKRQRATKANVTKAVRWLSSPKQAPKGWGAFYEPLEALLHEDVDTVVLLSDGRPSRGIYDRDFRILAEFPRTNRFYRLAVNTVLVGTKGADRKFMQALAAATGGRFREVAGE